MICPANVPLEGHGPNDKVVSICPDVFELNQFRRRARPSRSRLVDVWNSALQRTVESPDFL
jgi:hypothetical protein